MISNICTFKQEVMYFSFCVLFFPLEALSSGELSLEKYVEDLGSELSNPDVATRVQGLEKLSRTLLELDNHFLSEKQCTHLATFYCSRMKDHHMLVPPSLAGTLALVCG